MRATIHTEEEPPETRPCASLPFDGPILLENPAATVALSSFAAMPALLPPDAVYHSETINISCSETMAGGVGTVDIPTVSLQTLFASGKYTFADGPAQRAIPGNAFAVWWSTVRLLTMGMALIFTWCSFATLRSSSNRMAAFMGHFTTSLESVIATIYKAKLAATGVMYNTSRHLPLDTAQSKIRNSVAILWSRRFAFLACAVIFMYIIRVNLTHNIKISTTRHCPHYNSNPRTGGGARQTVPARVLSEYLHNDNNIPSWMDKEYTFEGQCTRADVRNILTRHTRCISVRIPLNKVMRLLTKEDILKLSKLHGVWVPTRLAVAKCRSLLESHVCTDQCSEILSIFEHILVDPEKKSTEAALDPPRPKKQRHGEKTIARLTHDALEKRKAASRLKMLRKQISGRIKGTKFPPLPLSRRHTHRIISNHCRTMRPKAFVEAGCVVCGCLVPKRFLTPLTQYQGSLALLVRDGVTRKERFNSSEPILELSGPILADNCTDICVDCETCLDNGVIPAAALVRHTWIGPVPEQLQGLTYAEGIMIAKVRHNRCVVRVNSGRVRMSANAIMFSQPVLSILNKLPPSRDEMNEILAFVFTGSCAPTQEDFERTPMLVRRQKVLDALLWLKLNHEGYTDLDISEENLATYPERGIPVVVDWKRTEDELHDSVPAGATSVHDDLREQGTRMGRCTFAVHGLTGTEYATAKMSTIKSVALQHLTHKGRMLGIGQSEEPVSMYDNVAAYPGMFPWLFPYGKGGIGHPSHVNKMKEGTRKRNLLMYHDKRFQLDTYFPMIAFNHEQLKAASTHSILLAKRAKFNVIARRLAAVNPDVAGDIADRMAKGDHVKPSNPSEQLCFDLIKDLDGVAGHVKGSITSKKYMRNEIWSTTAFFNAPTWFVTVAWNDLHHPLALYYAQTDTLFRPEIRTSAERNRLMSQNPVGAARFFHFMVKAFISDVLGWESEDRGVFGHTKAFYGTVEQQGRLTLHLHSLIWVANALSPQEIRERIMDPSSRFRARLIAYLEGTHRAEYFNGTRNTVISKRQVEPLGPDDDSDDEIDWGSSYRPPTQTFARAPPKACKGRSCPPNCSWCKQSAEWWEGYELEVDDLLVRSNVHTHYLSMEHHRAEDAKTARRKLGKKKAKAVQDFKIRRERKGCLTKLGVCRARFPRDIFLSTKMAEDGHIDVRHVEPMMNTVNPVLTYVSRCNSDVTSLLSGTAVKAVVSYVSDYVSKLSLKSFQMFASVYDVFAKNSEMLGGSVKDKEQARHMMRKMVNSMSAKMEIGSPMASMYLLGNPDCYASHKYVTFAWRPYVQFIRNFWVPVDTEATEHCDSDRKDDEERVPITKQDGKFIASSGVDDYRYRPTIYNNVTLYEWIQCSEKKKRSPKERAEFEEDLRLTKYLKADYHRAAMLRVAAEQEPELNNSDDEFEHEDEPDDGLWEPDQDSDFIHAGRWGKDEEDELSDWETDDEDDVIVSKQAKIDKSSKPVRHSFILPHELFLSHSVLCRFENLTKVIPNFIGGALPRSDKGDRAGYCMAMMTLFKPWRSPADLKNSVDTWDQAFKAHEFTPRQLELMQNFNVRFECNDSRDDHFAQLKKKLADAKKNGTSLFPASFMGYKDKFAEDLNEFDYGSDPDELDNDDDDGGDVKGPKTLKLLAEAKVMRQMMETSGWLDQIPPSGLPAMDIDRVLPPCKSRVEWASIIKKQRAELTANKLANLPADAATQNKNNKVNSGVKNLPHDYFNHRSRVDVQTNADIVSEIVISFELNPEQIRAFKLVTDHAAGSPSEPLRMYLGGMGGTGKSLVFHAMIEFFKRRKEEHRFMVLGPTGSTAALLNGSTYHSVFKLPRESKSKNHDDIEGIKNEGTTLAAVNERLQGVDYIFLDEISMVSCNDFQLLATQAAKARNIHDDSFGSLSVIVAGDFAQLPPMSGPSLYSGRVTLNIVDALDQRNQNAVLGKILWHQFNTVVILRQNMRQAMQGLEDAKLRTALENMRYGACTKADLEFLRTRVAGFRPENPRLGGPDFRNVSIITARNSQKDVLNQLGAQRFAEDTNQTLSDFCSIDKISSRAVDRNKWKGCEQSEFKKMTKGLQKKLWEAPPCTTNEFIPGKLSLCIGMSVMLRANDATEMCITKGQEGRVVGWDESTGPIGQRVLDTLFVELIKPPRQIQIEGLPLNVVPLVRTVSHITILLEDDTLLSVLREQIVALLNFGMTDYTSQGKSRPKNSVDLANCKTHMSYYVALSRGTTAKGTVIVQDLNETVVTKGISGYLRQELRELEILDEITRLRCEGRLPATVAGLYRRRLIRSYYAWKSVHTDPHHLHAALRWDPTMGPRVPPSVEYSEWTPSIPVSRKRKNAVNDISNRTEEPKRKRSRGEASSSGTSGTMSSFDAGPRQTPRSVPMGLIWDSRDHSCAYDATFTILNNIWAENPVLWSIRFPELGQILEDYVVNLQSVLRNDCTLEQARDAVRRRLHHGNPENFPYGPNPTSIDKLAEVLFPSKTYGFGRQSCGTCGYIDPREYGMLEAWMTATLENNQDVTAPVTLRSWITNQLTKGKRRCPKCRINNARTRMTMLTRLADVPPIMIIDILHEGLCFDRELSFDCAGSLVIMKLRGVIYGGQGHFACKFVDGGDSVWFHDGIATGRRCAPEGILGPLTDMMALQKSGAKTAVSVVYARV